ncbi:MAG: tRNA (adenosine(37)-N6)-threonylcarbamoyltransferase complex dimerization subunit type 1 TsaB [Eubacterium sp.]|nr:tRNA (adenosine(37)-N6)-threonylcarbamoyltransferase complex dimerization subunit type 1 TsaB [Eubacterium sp.]
MESDEMILAIDSSGLTASVALSRDGIVIGEYSIHNKKTHSQTILPMIDEMLCMAAEKKHMITAIAVASGPGSFTGLRIGAATAKGLAQGWDVPVIPVPTLMGLAYNLQGTSDIVCPIMDARRSQGYYGIFDVTGEVPLSPFFRGDEEDPFDAGCPVGDANASVQDCGSMTEGFRTVCQGVDSIEVIIERVINITGRTGRRPVFLGDGVPVFRNVILEKIPDAGFAPAHSMYQRASSVAVLGSIFFKQGKALKAADFTPEYFRLSQAERERRENKALAE